MKRAIVLMIIPMLLALGAVPAGAAEVISKKQYTCSDAEGGTFRCQVTRYRDEGWDISGGTHAVVQVVLEDGGTDKSHVFPCGVGCGYITLDDNMAYRGGAVEGFENDQALCECQ